MGIRNFLIYGQNALVKALNATGVITQTPGQGANNSTPFAQYGDLFSDAIMSGLTTTTSNTLTGTLAAGSAYVLGQRVPYPGGNYTVAASTTSYLDLSDTGVLTVSTSATVTANSLRLWAVTSSASAITGVTQVAASGANVSGPISCAPAALPADAVVLSQLGSLNAATAPFAGILPDNCFGGAYQIDGSATLPVNNGKAGQLIYLYGINNSAYTLTPQSNQFIYSPLIGRNAGSSSTVPLVVEGGQSIILLSRGTGEFDIIGGGVLLLNSLSPSFSYPISTPAILCSSSATLNGTTAGTITSTMPEQGVFKKFAAYANGFVNDSTTAQTITFPTAFANTHVIAQNTTGLSLTVSTTGVTITAPDNTTAYSGYFSIEGI